jgi:uncharacterized membrane protein YgcG
MGRVTVRDRVLRIRDGIVSERVDTLVAEEPMEIRLNGRPLTITMRTPGHDFDLAAGFLVGEGVVAARAAGGGGRGGPRGGGRGGGRRGGGRGGGGGRAGGRGAGGRRPGAGGAPGPPPR